MLQVPHTMQFEMVGGYTEDLTEPQNCQIGGSCMHTNQYMLAYIYSSICSALSVDLLAAYSM